MVGTYQKIIPHDFFSEIMSKKAFLSCSSGLWLSFYVGETNPKGRQICPSTKRYADLPINLSISR
jgi:hypothetical protein